MSGGIKAFIKEGCSHEYPQVGGVIVCACCNLQPLTTIHPHPVLHRCAFRITMTKSTMINMSLCV